MRPSTRSRPFTAATPSPKKRCIRNARAVPVHSHPYSGALTRSRSRACPAQLQVQDDKVPHTKGAARKLLFENITGTEYGTVCCPSRDQDPPMCMTLEEALNCLRAISPVPILGTSATWCGLHGGPGCRSLTESGFPPLAVPVHEGGLVCTDFTYPHLPFSFLD